MLFSPWILLLSLALAAGSIPLWNRWLRSPSWSDLPREDRHHRRPVPKTGGAGWLLGAVLGCLAGLPWSHAIPLGAALVLAFFLGRADDLGRLAPGRKWILQTALLLGVWVVLRGLPEGGGPRMARGLSGQGPGILPGAAALLVALVLQTALEIFDNLDGALGLTACAALMTVSLASATPWAAAAAVAGAGASLGFLLWNRPPAAVHLGNAGSQALALLVSLLVLQTLFPAPASVLRGTSGGFQGPSGVRWAILLPVAWPLFDLLFVTAGRLRRGLPPWRGGRDHTTHRLARALGSDGVVTGMIAVASGLGLAAAVWMHLARR